MDGEGAGRIDCARACDRGTGRGVAEHDPVKGEQEKQLSWRMQGRSRAAAATKTVAGIADELPRAAWGSGSAKRARQDGLE